MSIKIVEITQYITPDAEQFATEREAVAHAKPAIMENLKESIWDALQPSNNTLSNYGVAVVAEMLYDNRCTFISMLKDINHRTT